MRRRSIALVIPPPKSISIKDLVEQGAHVLDKFLYSEGVAPKTATQRELMVDGLVTKLSTLSTEGRALSRHDLIGILVRWSSEFIDAADLPWERVVFNEQRGIESAIAGYGLGPQDVVACPDLDVCDDIEEELSRAFVYELVGTPGCGKSITAWKVAKRFYDRGYAVWRPRVLGESQLLAAVPAGGPRMLILDNAHLFEKRFASRLGEIAKRDCVVLLVSTVSDSLSSNIICIPADRCVEQLRAAVLARKDEILPIVQSYDSRVSDQYFSTSFESRVESAARQQTPWEFFWVLRGGWQTAHREFADLRQFPFAQPVLFAISLGQVVSCDQGVSFDWLLVHLAQIGVTRSQLESSLETLRSLKRILPGDSIRTKHITYADQAIEQGLNSSDAEEWPHFKALFVSSILDEAFSLKGVCWLLDSTIRTSRRWKSSQFESIFRPLIDRSVDSGNKGDWAAGLMSHLCAEFEMTVADVLKYKHIILQWCVDCSGLVSRFCGNIINHLINCVRNDDEDSSKAVVRAFISEIDVGKLIVTANNLELKNFSHFGYLLNRLAYWPMPWAKTFIDGFDWNRTKNLILAAPADRAFAVDELVQSVTRMAFLANEKDLYRFIRDVVPFLADAFNSNPAQGLEDTDDIWELCLGYAPRFLRGNVDPDFEQRSVAKNIVSQFNPVEMARTINQATSRELEKMARACSKIREVDPNFIERVSELICETEFFAATGRDWRLQSSELNHFLRFFCQREDFEPAHSWIRVNRARIEGALSTLFVGLAPDVAVQFCIDGKAVELIDVKCPDWTETSFAIKRLAQIDHELSVKLVDQQLDNFIACLYDLSLDGAKPFVIFFLTIERLNPSLFQRIIDAINLNDTRAQNTISQLVSGNQEDERTEYLRLAQIGVRRDGKVKELSEALIKMLDR